MSRGEFQLRMGLTRLGLGCQQLWRKHRVAATAVAQADSRFSSLLEARVLAAVLAVGNHLYLKWLDGNSLFRNNREFEMTEQGI